MTKIYRYPIEASTIINLPLDYSVIHFGAKQGYMNIWIQGDFESEVRNPVEFNIFATGETIPNNYYVYQSCVVGAFEWHLGEKFVDEEE